MTDSLQHTHKTLVIIRISNKLLLVSLVTEYERLSTCWGHYFVPTMVPYTECYRFVVVTFLSPDNDKQFWCHMTLLQPQTFRRQKPVPWALQRPCTHNLLSNHHHSSPLGRVTQGLLHGFHEHQGGAGGQVGPDSQPITPQWDVCRQTTALGTMFLTLCALQCGGEGDKISATFNSFVPHDNFPNLTYFQSCIQSLLFC